MPTELLRVEGLSKFFRLRRRLLAREERLARAVDGVSFSLDEGEILGVVGESGCGKTTLARLILRLIEPSSGRIWLDGTEITGLSQTELRRWRQRMQIVFQDHLASLDPRVTIGRSIGFPLEVHGLAAGRVLRAAVEDLLQRVGLDRLFYGRLPHQLSGGQRQRVTIARALAVDPRLIVADEPVASLDLSAQGQILNLFADLLKERGISYIFITHDLNVAAYLCDRIMVMYGGKVVELAPAGEIFARPRHPYTQALISAAMLGGLQSQIGKSCSRATRRGRRTLLLDANSTHGASSPAPTAGRSNPNCVQLRSNTARPAMSRTVFTSARSGKCDPKTPYVAGSLGFVIIKLTLNLSVMLTTCVSFGAVPSACWLEFKWTTSTRGAQSPMIHGMKRQRTKSGSELDVVVMS